MNLPPKTPVTIRKWRDEAEAELTSAGIGTARLDAELILSHTLKKSRTYLHAYHENTLSRRELEVADARLALRLDRVPLAYIIGHKEFYGRQFDVTPATLIPRPESEAIITLLQKHLPEAAKRLVDVGTGSGCLGITAKLEYPALHVTLADISEHALTVAVKNAKRYTADVITLRSDLLDDYPFNPDIILANLPYVDLAWERSPETSHEPSIALFAKDHGLALIKKLLVDANARLTPRGLIILEADPRQMADIEQFATRRGLILLEQQAFAAAYQKPGN